MPAGVEALPFPRFDETMYWLPGPRALVPGDRLIGDGEGGVRLCPASWLGLHPACGTLTSFAGPAPAAGAAGRARAVSHWGAVVGGGHAALERALG